MPSFKVILPREVLEKFSDIILVISGLLSQSTKVAKFEK